jgi:hypothetical protein
MALFSDVDWIIVLTVGAFVLFGREGRVALRQLGRFYARAMRLKDELLREVTDEAGLGFPPGAPRSLRGLLTAETAPPPGYRPGVPAAVSVAPSPAALGPSATSPGTWSVAIPALSGVAPGREP